MNFLRTVRRPLLFALAAPASALARCDEAKPEFQTVTCVRNEYHTHDTRKITLMAPDLWPNDANPIANVLVRVGTPGGEAGCCACCKCPSPCGCPKTSNGCCACCSCSGKCGCPKKSVGAISRPYNPISFCDSGVTLTLLVKRYPEAKMGTALHTLKPGESVDVKGPNQQWKFEAGKHQHYGFVAGGTGITPIMQAMQHVLQHDTAKVSLITLNKTTGDILLRSDIDKLQKQYPGRLNVTHVVEHGNDFTEGTIAVHGELDAWSTTRMMKGRASTDILSALPASGAEGVMVMVCGRPPMTAAIAGKKNKDWTQGPVGGMLKELGYGEQQVWKI